jgi:hypothetical protein
MRPHILVSWFFVIIIALLLLSRSWFSNPIAWDGFGYFLYLPLLFIHHDLGISDPAIIEEMFATYQPSDTFYQAHLAPTGHWVIRYTPGLALLHLPAFLVAHFLAGPLGFPEDGLSMPYQVGVLVTSLLCLWAGLFALQRALNTFSQGVIPTVVVALLLFGTNLFDQIIEHPLMTHLYTFALLSVLLYTTQRLHSAPDNTRALLAGTILGVLVLVRPTNILAVLIPALWPLGDEGPITKWRSVLRAHRSSLIAFLVSAVSPIFLLLLYWRFYAGSWLYNSYQNPGEGLDLLQPHLFSFLFSYRKGWLLYTPLVLLGIAGLLFAIPRKWHSIRLPLLTFLLCFLYTVSCWTVWYYPGGFGQRAAVDVLPVVGVGMAFMLERARRMTLAWRSILVVTVTLLVAFMHFQIWQQRQHFRPPDRMTKAYYWATLTHTRPEPGLDHLLGPDRIQVASSPDTSHYHLHGRWQVECTAEGKVFGLSQDVPFTPAWEQPYQALTNTDHAWVQVSGELQRLDTTEMHATLVLLMEHEGSYGYREFPLPGMGASTIHGWQAFSCWYLTPIPRSATDHLRVYGWHRAGAPVRLRKMEVCTWVPRSADVKP